MKVKINRGKWLKWWYENGSEHEYLLMLRAVRADQQANPRPFPTSATKPVEIKR